MDTVFRRISGNRFFASWGGLINREGTLSFLCAIALVGLVVDPARSLGAEAREMVLVEGGVAKCEVVAVGEGSKGAGMRVKQRYFKETSGVTVPVTDGRSRCQGQPIFVGGREAVEAATGLGLAVDKAAWEDLSTEGYLIHCSGDVLLLAGKTGLSVFYAVDKFLEKYFGVRWFIPGRLGEVVPISETVESWRNRGGRRTRFSLALGGQG